MIKGWISSIFGSHLEKIDIVEAQSVSLFPDIPFFGKKGTICRVEETENSYNKVVYNYDGTINPIKIATPKRKGKNLSAVTEEYYRELKKYLDFTNDEYMSCRKNRLHKQIHKKYVKVGMIASVVMAILSFPAWFSSIQVVSYIGAILEAASLFSLYITCDLTKAIQKDEKKKAFIERYNQYQEKLVTYHSERTQNLKMKKTHYTEISGKVTSVELDQSKPKAKRLMKEEVGTL